MKCFNYAAMALIATAVLTGCSDEQSVFDINEIPGRCTIEGTVVYNQGTTYENGKFVYDYKAAANLELTVAVTSSSYDTSLSGISYFTTTTDEQGKYSIEIPAPRHDMVVNITSADFTTTRSVVKIVNNKVQTEQETVVLRANQSIGNIHAQGIVLASMECMKCNADQSFVGFKEYATVSGLIGQNTEYKVAAKTETDEFGNIISIVDAKRYKAFIGAPNTDFVITVNYPQTEDLFTYNATTDANGNFTLQIPVKDYPAQFDFSIQCVSSEASFKTYEAVEKIKRVNNRDIRYIDYEEHTLTGYKTQIANNTYNVYLPVSAARFDFKYKALYFMPFSGQKTYGYSYADFIEAPWLDDILNNSNL